MRLFEILHPALFLCTKEPQAIGSEVTRQTSIYPLGTTLEGRLEQGRPEGCLPREHSLFLFAEPHYEAAHCYEVTPVGKVERNHKAWLRKLEQADPKQVGVIDQNVTGYWSGKVCVEDRDAAWEYRVAKVEVISARNRRS